MWAFVAGMFVGLIVLLVGIVIGAVIAAFVYSSHNPEENGAYRGN